MSGGAEPAGGGAGLPGGGRAAIDTSVAHSARVHDARFFDGLDMAEPGLVPVQEWRPRSAAEAGARSAMWGGVGRKR